MAMSTTLIPLSINATTPADECVGFPENSSNILNRHGQIDGLYTLFTIKSGMEKITTPIWMTVGIPGAILSLIIWTRKPMRQSSSIYLATLAVFDLLLFIHQTFWYLVSAWQVPALNLPVWCELFAVMYLFIQYMSPLLTLGFTVERYISICFPFRREILCTNQRAIKVTLGLIALGLSLCLIQGYFFEYQDGMCSARAEVTDPTKWQWRLILYWSVVTEVVIFGLVPISILLVNVAVIRETRRIANRGPSGAGRSTGNAAAAATTVMLLSVSFYLICACLPVSICQVFIHTVSNGPFCLTDAEIPLDPVWRAHFRFINVQTLLNSLSMSHYAAKFYIYLLTGRLFRQQLLLLFTPLCPNFVSKMALKSVRSPEDGDMGKFTYSTKSNNFRSTRRNNRKDANNGSGYDSPAVFLPLKSAVDS